VLGNWIRNNLRSVRFSGGEPVLYPHINELVNVAKSGNIKNIAISSNGSLERSRYDSLLLHGVNDFSISLDACCAETADIMAGRTGYFDTVIGNIKYLASRVYTTVGIVLTKETEPTLIDVIKYSDSLGVSDIRIITAAQYNGNLGYLSEIPMDILDKYPILKYRVNNLISGRNVRGISQTDSKRCYLVKDDSVVAGQWHFPCVIHMREGGAPIGKITDDMQAQRSLWSKTHNTHNDLICVENCLDCLVDYNNKCEFHKGEK
jgi:molybdenum cofactor biosynthesis enzyme MoaA